MTIITVTKRDCVRILITTVVSLFFISVFLVPVVLADALVTSQLGFHPDAHKRAVLYNGAASFIELVDAADVDVVHASFPLTLPTNYEGGVVACQGNLPCLIADFSSFDTPGKYYLRSDTGLQSNVFVISDTVYVDNVPVLLDFFNALLQVNSSYHPDMHESHRPSLPVIADGSFILEADQASVTLIRLGSAYSHNPSLFAFDSHNILGTGLPDIAEYMTLYADYLLSLQGVVLDENSQGLGVRTGTGMRIENAFVPGPVVDSSATVFYSLQGGASQEVDLVSLCGVDDGSSSWDACVAYAAEYYKCQVDEVCLNLTYDGPSGYIVDRSGYEVSTGWSYEFQCYPDVAIGQPVFTDNDDPCLIFDASVNRSQTVLALHALLASIPAVEEVDPVFARLIAARSLNTYDSLAGDAGGVPGHLGAAAFLLYEYTGDSRFLFDAYAFRNTAATTLLSDGTFGSEFYWAKYVEHREDLLAANLDYRYGGAAPEEFFRGKMYFDFKDRWVAISDAGELIFVFNPGQSDFHNARPVLVEGILAAKTALLHPDPEPFISTIADSQLSWMTGLNRVQDGISQSPPLASYSFIFGIGDNPQSQHTRLLLNSGYYESTNGSIVGARSSQFFFADPDTEGVYLEYDGVATILGQSLGALGNRWHNESYNDPFKDSVFANGKEVIDGWIIGAYDVPQDTDVIYNFDDAVGAWRYTESTNEIVAAAVELFAYLDAVRNDRSPVVSPSWSVAELQATADGLQDEFVHDVPVGPVCGDGVIEGSEQCDDGNTVSGDGCSSSCTIEDVVDDGCATSVAELPVSCGGEIMSDSTIAACRMLTCESLEGSVTIKACDKDGFFEMYKQDSAGVEPNICLGNTCLDGWGYKQGGSYPVCAGDAPVCGDGVVEGLEACDDGNTVSGDGCSSSCTVEQLDPVCGDGVVEGLEACDDGNVIDGDGCSSSCLIEDSAGGDCASSVSQLPVSCVSSELTSDTLGGSCRAVSCVGSTGSVEVLACDKDGYFEMYKQSSSGYGVDVCLGNTCLDGWGYKQGGSYPVCEGDAAICGDGIIDSTEECDDGNSLSGDGCSSSCTVEQLDPVCGDGVVEGSEQCDDGNALSGDGCSSSCTIEADGEVAVTLSVKQWYPKGLDYIFVCQESGFEATSYEWVFGDGDVQVTFNEDVYHTYPAVGEYVVSCIASDATASAVDSLVISAQG